MSAALVREARPGDYDAIAAVIDGWWGRPVLLSLPRMFFDHFHRTSLVIDGQGGPVAFLVGILSPSNAEQAYIHFAGVAPEARHLGLGKAIYEAFFALAKAHGRNMVRAVTSPANSGSVAFHRSLGFTVTGPVPDYNGPGHDRIVFERPLYHLGMNASSPAAIGP